MRTEVVLKLNKFIHVYAHVTDCLRQRVRVELNNSRMRVLRMRERRLRAEWAACCDALLEATHTLPEEQRAVLHMRAEGDASGARQLAADVVQNRRYSVLALCTRLDLEESAERLREAARDLERACASRACPDGTPSAQRAAS